MTSATAPLIQAAINEGEEDRYQHQRTSDYYDEEEDENTPFSIRGSWTKFQTALRHTLHEWREHPMGVFKRNIFLVTLLFFITASQLLVKNVSVRVQGLEGGAFALGQAQPAVAAFAFSIAWGISLLWDKYQTHRLRKHNIEYDESDFTYDYDVPKRHLAFVGTFLSIGNVFLFMGSGSKSVPGPVSVLLQQMVIPATLVISIFWFRTRFFLGHYIGAVIILIGIGVTVYSPKHNPTTLALEATGSDSASTGTIAWAVACIIGAAVSNAIGMGYMEYRVVSLGKNINLAWMWMWINLFEIFVTFPMLPIVAPLQVPPLPYKQLFPDLGASYGCIFGNHTPENAVNVDCSGTIQLYVPLIMMFVCSRLNIAYVIKMGSAALMWFVATAALPIEDIFFTFHWVSGSNPPTLTGNIIGGLILVMVGLLTYRFSRDPQKHYYSTIRGIFDSCLGRGRGGRGIDDSTL